MIHPVARLLQWTLRQLGLYNLLALGLLVVIEISVVTGIAGTVDGLDALLLVVITVISLLAGWGLASTSLPGWKACVLLLALGLIVLFLRVGQLGDELWALAQAVFDLAFGVLPWWLVWAVLQRPPRDLTVNWSGVTTALSDIGSDLSTLLVRVYIWLQSLVAGELAFDPVAATLVWGLALWLVAAWAGWALRRASPLLAIAPGGVLLMAVLSFNWGDTAALLTLLGATLLLLALVAYATRQRRWLVLGIDFPDLGADTTVAVVFVSVMLVVSAAVAPAITLRSLSEFMSRFALRQLSESAGDESSAAPVQGAPVQEGPLLMEKSRFGELRSGGLPRRHLLGSGPELSRQVVMVISTGELPPEMAGIQAPRYYWRSITYDVYTGRGWVTREPQTMDYDAGEELDVAAFDAQRELQQAVRIVGDVGGLLHVAGTLVVVDHDYTVAWRSPEDVFGVTLESTAYQAVSLVSTATEEQLRSVGSNYPQWIQDRYVGLPRTVPDRVLGLARDLTATEPTPYDRALAIETYLRNYPYSLDVPLPPAGVSDVVDYFLFDLQEGYCDYYATSMVVLARAAGLPARLAMGYASGYYDFHRAIYVVTEADAHAWVEVYFPGYGWIDFEPTGGRPPIQRSSEGSAAGLPHLEETPETLGGGWGVLGRLACWNLCVLPVLPVLAGGVWLVVDGWQLRRLEPSVAVVALYGRLRRHGRQLAVPMRTGDTPYEFGGSFADWSAKMAREKRWGKVLAGAIPEVHRLVDLYVEASYTAHSMGRVGRWHALQAWWNLRWRLWLAWLLQWRPSLPRRGWRRLGKGGEVGGE